jgi:hypothetical protein
VLAGVAFEQQSPPEIFVNSVVVPEHFLTSYRFTVDWAFECKEIGNLAAELSKR